MNMYLKLRHIKVSDKYQVLGTNVYFAFKVRFVHSVKSYLPPKFAAIAKATDSVWQLSRRTVDKRVRQTL